MSLTHKRLEQAYKNAHIVKFDNNSKFIIMSDCHRGRGNVGDNFLPNQNLFYGALKYYYKNGFSYIELGDGDELWENRKLSEIVDVHSDAFWIMSKFHQKKRIYMIYGNHDIVKNKRKYIEKHCKNHKNNTRKCNDSIFKNLKAHESIILENYKINSKIFLVHGHQGDLLNDMFWPLARFLVRYLWRPLELIGFKAPISAGVSHQKRDKIEKKLSKFAKYKNHILISGHTHRPIFPQPGSSLYFNDGSCIHPRCITGIEIENNQISLIKWSVCTGDKQNLYVCRHILEGPRNLSDYVKNN